MTPTNTKPQWEDYKKMIAKLAWKYSQSFGIEHDELMSEGNLIFVKATRTHDARRGKFSTFLWKCLTNGLQTFCTLQNRQAHYDCVDADALLNIGHNEHVLTTRSLHIRQSIAALPTTASAAIYLFASTPAALGLSGSEPPKMVRGAFIKHLHACGESWAAARGSLRKIESIYQEA